MREELKAMRAIAEQILEDTNDCIEEPDYVLLEERMIANAHDLNEQITKLTNHLLRGRSSPKRVAQNTRQGEA